MSDYHSPQGRFPAPSLNEFFAGVSVDSYAVTSSDEDLIRLINQLSENELRSVLQHIALVHPEVLHGALKHVSYGDDMHSVMTEQASNIRRYDEPPPIPFRTEGVGGHPSKRGSVDEDEDDYLPQHAPTRQQRPSLPPQIPKRGQSPPPPLDELAEDKENDGDEDSSEDEDITVSQLSGACFLLYDPNSSCLLIEYSKEETVEEALAMWTPQPPHKIRDFKFTEQRSQLIGNCAAGVQGRKNYYSGWCQFVRLAKALNGTVTVLSPSQSDGIAVDLFLYYAGGPDYNSTKAMSSFETLNLDAVACLPKHSQFYDDLRIDFSKWMTEASTIGSATAFAPSKPPSPTRSRRLSPPRPPESMGSSPTLTRPKRNGSGQKKEKKSKKDSRKGIPAPPSTSPKGGKGSCYLVYEPDSSGKLLLHYSKTPIANAVGKWIPGVGHKIQSFKYVENHGRAELIDNCAAGLNGKKNYYSGWCHFVRAAKSMEGLITVWDPTSTGLFVDLYIYIDDNRAGHQTIQLLANQAHDLSAANVLAIACLPKHTKFYDSITVDINKWLDDANALGAGSRF